MVRIRAKKAQDDLSFDGAQYPSYHTCIDIFSRPQQTCCGPTRNEHLSQSAWSRIRKVDFSFSSQAMQYVPSLSPSINADHFL